MIILTPMIGRCFRQGKKCHSKVRNVLVTSVFSKCSERLFLKFSNVKTYDCLVYSSPFFTQSQVFMTLWKTFDKTFWEKENMLITSIFSYCHEVLYHDNDRKHILTLSQTTKFQTFHNERVCRRQFQI